MSLITLYHGTRVENALQIGQDGMLLSPYEQFVRDQLAGKRKPSREEAERLAQMQLKRVYAEHELGHRGHGVSLTCDFRLAQDYAQHYDSFLSRGGVILEFEVSCVPDKWNTTGVIQAGDRELCAPIGTIYVPEQFALDTLTAIHFTPRAWREENYEPVTDVFERFRPEYFLLEECGGKDLNKSVRIG